MQPFSELTARGQAGRLRALARAALAHYDLDVRAIRLLTNHLNGIFRVDTRDGQRYVLRISHPTWRTAVDLRSELLWLAALGRETDIGAPVPHPARSGEWVTTVAVPGVPESRRCVLLSWIPGRDLGERLGEANLYALGVLAARLHTHAAGWTPPPASPGARWPASTPAASRMCCSSRTPQRPCPPTAGRCSSGCGIAWRPPSPACTPTRAAGG